MSDTELTCSRCTNQLLAIFSAFENRLHRCESCEGLWVPTAFVESLAKKPELRTRLQPLAERAAGSGVEPTAALAKPAFCAECRAKLERFEAGGSSKIFLDRCRAHGTWFDKDELGRVVAFLQANPKVEVVTAAMKKDRTKMSASRPPSKNDDLVDDLSDGGNFAFGLIGVLIDIFF